MAAIFKDKCATRFPPPAHLPHPRPHPPRPLRPGEDGPGEEEEDPESCCRQNLGSLINAI